MNYETEDIGTNQDCFFIMKSKAPSDAAGTGRPIGFRKAWLCAVGADSLIGSTKQCFSFEEVPMPDTAETPGLHCVFDKRMVSLRTYSDHNCTQVQCYYKNSVIQKLSYRSAPK